MAEEKNLDPMLAMYFGTDTDQAVEPVTGEEPIEPATEPATEEPVEEQAATEPIAEPVAEPATEEPEAKVWQPEFKSDIERSLYDKLSKGEVKDVYELLRPQFEHESYDEDRKMLAYLEKKNPHLSSDDIAWKAATEYGIGATKIDEEDITPDVEKAIKKQEIDRKGLLNEADTYFKEQAKPIELPPLPTALDLDEDYKNYKLTLEQQQKIREDEEAVYNSIIKEIDSTSIESIDIEEKIELDDSEFAISSTFKLDATKQKQLSEYAKRYTPTEEEGAQFTKEGKLATREYMAYLAQKLFAEQIRKAAIKEAIVKDRESFVERELKNSTLRNNSVMQQADKEFDPVTYVMGIPN